MGLEFTDPSWDDLRFPMTGNRVDVSNGRIDYDYFNCTMGFQQNARYPNEPICMLAQLPHAKEYGTPIRPHIHWLQQATDMPNWLLAYQVIRKNEAAIIETDYSNFTLLPWAANAFTFIPGGMHQITVFDEIPLVSEELSDCIKFVLFRDSSNISGEFSGADPSSLTEHVLEFDGHVKFDGLGSHGEFSKTI